ncbi:hypothetical protein [Conexibacter sp. DBS9H8]|uniref:hypothetical protein n=1 Tax=Conexibacter sp. DBS9H8 TaxID=2937801 RepID=UPI00200FD23D|nr:hypothetical protein [Conexibacter sp. DBS9H8]
MRCPFCPFTGARGDVHAHLVSEHADGVEIWAISDSRRRYLVTCPVCGAAHEARVKPRSKDPDFLETFAREIRMVAYDMLLNHVTVEHPELMVTERSQR